ncbi:hypothetical protein BDAP_002508 [Binucleata daphniae]
MRIQCVVLYLLIVLFITCLGCFSRNDVHNNVESFAITKKYIDKVYLRQATALEDCLYDLELHIFNCIEHYKNMWTEEAVNDIAISISPSEKKVFKSLNYKQCIEIIAEHNANRFMCRAFEIAIDEEDMLLKYALEEYFQCINYKGKKQNNPLTFKMPQIGIGNIEGAMKNRNKT